MTKADANQSQVVVFAGATTFLILNCSGSVDWLTADF